MFVGLECLSPQYIQYSPLVPNGSSLPTPHGCRHFECLSSYFPILHRMILITIFRNHWLLRTSLYTLTCDSVCSKSKVKDLTIFRNYCLLSTSLYTFTFDSLCPKSKDKELTKLILRPWDSPHFLLPPNITPWNGFLVTLLFFARNMRTMSQQLLEKVWQ